MCINLFIAISHMTFMKNFFFRILNVLTHIQKVRDLHQDWFIGHEDKVTTQNFNMMHQHISTTIFLMTFTNHKNLPWI